MKMIEDEVLEGVVASFNKDRGFGFITTNKCDLFIHHTNINMSGYRLLEEGQKVTFSIGPGRNGRIQAVDVTVIN